MYPTPGCDKSVQLLHLVGHCFQHMELYLIVFSTSSAYTGVELELTVAAYHTCILKVLAIGDFSNASLLGGSAVDKM